MIETESFRNRWFRNRWFRNGWFRNGWFRNGWFRNGRHTLYSERSSVVDSRGSDLRDSGKWTVGRSG